MSDQTGGRFSSGGDDADESVTRDVGQDDAQTDGIEILDDGADWLAEQLAALPPDTTEIDLPRGPEAEKPVAEEPVAQEPVSEEPVSEDLAADVPSERGDEPAVELEPTREPQPTEEPRQAAEPEPAAEPAQAAEPQWAAGPEPAAEPASQHEAPYQRTPAPDAEASSPGPESAPPVPPWATPSNPETTPAGSAAEDPAPVPPRPAHPQAIVLPGLPPRRASAQAVPAVPPPLEPDAGPEPDAATEVREPERTSATDAGESREARPVGAVSAEATETGDIEFGAFSWSLVANDEPDPVLQRAQEVEAARRAQEETARRAAESDAERRSGAAAAAAIPVVPEVIPTEPPHAEVRPAPATPFDPASGPDADPRGDERSEAPTWSRPDLDGAFPETMAMDALPADEDPDDPDDELDTRERTVALGESSMPVSAASAAAGTVEHLPARSRPEPDHRAPVPAAGPFAEPFPQPTRERPDERGRRGMGTLGLVGAGLVVLLALVALFYLGTRLPLLLGGAPQAEASATPSATPTPSEAAEQPATGPLGAGTYAWDQLRGGECLDPFESPWAEEFTVVDCAAPHAAQLVFAAPYTDDPATPFPGEDVIASEIGLLCSAPGVVDFAAAASFTDLQVQGAYPVSGEQWAAGQRDYFCFATRSSGEPLTASVAGTP